MKGNVLRTKIISIVAVAAAIASAALTLLPWIDISRLGFPIRWNGLGKYIGKGGEDYGALLSGMVNGSPGWILLIASIAAAVMVVAATRVRWLGIIACGCGIAAFVTAVLCLVYPAILMGGTRHELGASGLVDRDFVNSGSLIAEVVATAVLVVCTALVALRGKAGRIESDVTQDAG